MFYCTVYRRCAVEFNGDDYAIFHGDRGVRVIGSNCSDCRCNNGQLEECYPIVCPFASDHHAGHSCTVDEETYSHLETFDDDCNMCVCLNGDVVCTKLVCGDDDDESDDGVAVCHSSVHKPVCGVNLRTYPNQCAAQASGLSQLEILPGACTREVCIVCVFVCVYKCIYVYVYVCVCVYMCVYVRMCVCVLVCMCLCISVCAYACV